MPRQPEPESMDVPEEVVAYAAADFAGVNQAFVDRLVELVGRCEDALALDLGVGPGDIPVRVVRALPGWRVVAVDASYPMLEAARGLISEAKLSKAVQPVQADAKRCPFAAGSFDVVYSNSILHHITEVDLLWAEVKRVARPGAMVLLRDLARPGSPEAARRIVGQHAGSESSLLQDEFYRSLLSSYTPEEVREQIAGAGLGMLKVEMVSDRHFDVFGRVE